MGGFWLLCLMPYPCSTIFQLISGSQFYWKKLEYRVKTTDQPQITDKVNHIMLYTSPWAGFELTPLVVIGTDRIGNCKSNYHAITTTTAREHKWHVAKLKLINLYLNTYNNYRLQFTGFIVILIVVVIILVFLGRTGRLQPAKQRVTSGIRTIRNTIRIRSTYDGYNVRYISSIDSYKSRFIPYKYLRIRVKIMMFNATFNNISGISYREIRIW
jgi:hypothetical protein